MYLLHLNTLSEAFSFTKRLLLRKLFNNICISVGLLWLCLGFGASAQDQDSGIIQYDIPQNIYLNDGQFQVISQIEGVYPQFINQDEYLDIVIAVNANLNTQLLIMLGQADQSFVQQEVIAIGQAVRKLQFAQINGDEMLDIVVSDQSLVTRVFLGQGDGNFQSQSGSFSTQHDFELGDFNQDNTTDLIIDNQFYAGNGDGTFELGRPFFELSPTDIYTLNKIDVNRDEKLDLILGANSQINIYTGNGHGAFSLLDTYAIEGVPSSMVVANWNQDALPDFAVFASHAVYTFVNQGEGAFSLNNPFNLASVNPWLIQGKISQADINEDTYPDLLINSSQISGRIFTLLGDGQGNFPSLQAYETAAEFSQGFSLGDFNQDGHQDIAYPHSTTIEFAYGDGLSNFSLPRTHVSGSGVMDLAANDFNNDQIVDIVAASNKTNGLNLSFGRGNGTFEKRVATPATTNQNVITSGDFINNDPLPDIALVSQVGDLLIARPREGRPFINDSTQVDVQFSNPSELLSNDFNQDSQKDLAIAHQDTISILLGQGNGTFEVAGQFPTEGLVQTFLTEDYNQDGFLDFIVMTSEHLDVYYSSADTYFAQRFAISQANFVGSLGQADFNQDGWQDLVTLIEQDAKPLLCLHYGQADGTFQEAIVLDTDYSADKLLVNDLNTDGLSDIILGNTRSGDLEILQNQGQGNFQSIFACQTNRFRTFICEDLNGDALPEILIQHEFICSIFINISKTASSPLKIESFTIIDAETDTPLQALLEGDTINTEEVGSLLAIVAQCDSQDIGSVQFNLNGRNFAPENFAPFALGRNQGDNYFGLNFAPGSYTLTATPYPSQNFQGEAGIPLLVNFEVIEDNPLSAFTIYPNQTSDLLHIQSKAALPGSAQIQVFDRFGRLLLETKLIGQEMLDLHLAKYGQGLFFIRLQNGQTTQFKRVLLK